MCRVYIRYMRYTSYPVSFWVRKEFLERVDTHAQKAQQSRSEFLRCLIEDNLDVLEAWES